MLMKSTIRSPHVLFIAAEADPFIKIGGLGDVSGSLPLALNRQYPEIDIRLVIPYYDAIHQKQLQVKEVARFSIPSTTGDINTIVYETNLEDLPVYLIDGEPITINKPVYGTNFEMDAEKFIYFSLACLALPKYLHWSVDILHANDWHTAIAIHALALQEKIHPELRKIKKILTLHNLPFMGTGSENALKKFMIPAAKNPRMPVWARTLPLPMGINSADRIIAVSSTYAQEIMTPEFGCDLQNFIISKQKHLIGIVNGIDYKIWDPETDSNCQPKYSINTLEERIENKTRIQKEFSLPKNPSIPLFAFIGRMDRQKGIDLALSAFQKLDKNTKWQAIFLGTGDKTLESEVQALQEKFPDQFRAAIRFDSSLSHRLYAGADILLMPSRYEPCGLSQIIAMRYGCVPVARATGGLKDTIENYVPGNEHATGFLFDGHESEDLLIAINNAISTFSSPEIWKTIQINGMKKDFSWQISAEKYYNTYISLLSSKTNAR